MSRPRRIRPVTVEESEQAAVTTNHGSEQVNRPASGNQFLVGGLLGSVLLLLALGTGIYLLFRPSTPRSAPIAFASTAPPVGQTVIVENTAVPTPTPDCTAAPNYLDIITRQEQDGDWAAAASTAETALRLPHLCVEDKRALTTKAIAAGLQVLYSEGFAPLDVVAQQRAIDRYLQLKARARQAGVDFPTSLQVAQQAYQIGQFPLAKLAIEQSLAEGEFKPELNRSVVRQYVSTLYNLGAWYTTASTDSELYQQGLQSWAASQAVAEAFCTGQAEAWQELRARFGDHRADYPSPIPTPFLSYATTGCS